MSIQEIDWKSAPADATHYHPGNQKFYFMDDFGVIFAAGEDRRFGRVYAPKPWRDGLIPRQPEVVEWGGDGIPPVGAIVECAFSGGRKDKHPLRGWLEGDHLRVVAHVTLGSERNVLFWNLRTQEASTLRDDCFRPLRTAEQIAADAALEEIARLYAEGGPAAVYDAGYRKIAEENESDD